MIDPYLYFEYSLRLKYDCAGAWFHDFCSLQDRARFQGSGLNKSLLCLNGLFIANSSSQHVHRINSRSDELLRLL